MESRSAGSTLTLHDYQMYALHVYDRSLKLYTLRLSLIVYRVSIIKPQHG